MKKPWAKFYFSDWRSDPRLRMCGLAARGLWLEMLALMHEAEPYGHLLVEHLIPTDAQLAVLAGTVPEQIPELLGELESAKVFSRTNKGVIFSRRMTRDFKKAQTAKKNGKSGGNPTLRKTTAIKPLDKPDDKPPHKAQRPETRDQKEKEEEDLLLPPPDLIGEAVALWNAMAGPCGLSVVQRVTDQRKASLRLRLEECGGLDGWRDALEIVRSTPFLRGVNKQKWKATFDFLLQPSSFLKVVEGGYGERDAAPVVGGDSPDEHRARLRIKSFRSDPTGWRWGHPPTDPRCQEPAKILIEYGYREKDAA